MITVADIEARCAERGVTLTEFWVRLRRLTREPDGWPTVTSLRAASEPVASHDQAMANDLEMQAEAMRRRLTAGHGRPEPTAPAITIITCSRERPKCYRCGASAVTACDAEHHGMVGVEVCGRPLCADHARGTRCSQHAPETSNSTMPKPPRKPA